MSTPVPTPSNYGWSNTKTLRVALEMTVVGDASKRQIAALFFEWLCADGDEDMPGEILAFDNIEVSA